MDERELRRADNESFFRDVNERLERRAALNHEAAPGFAAVCECTHESCVDRIPISYADYERVRSDPRRFVVSPGHVDPAVEHIVDEHARFTVVEKGGAAGERAEHADPRSDDAQSGVAGA